MMIDRQEIALEELTVECISNWNHVSIDSQRLAGGIRLTLNEESKLRWMKCKVP